MPIRGNKQVPNCTTELTAENPLKMSEKTDKKVKLSL
jgi:hypothetical protein